MQNKRGQIGWQQIVGAVIVGVVILVSVLIITSQSKVTNESLNDCQSKGGECIDAEECDYGPSFIPGCEDNKICCIDP
tara:strand:- start:3778 stop:4011 length:234 start_codon:yes stop_codon:yes gene_type:complete